MVYAHQHNLNKTEKNCRPAKTVPKETVREKCSFCDSMHHNSMVKENGAYLNAVFVSRHTFKIIKYPFKSLSLILSFGRAPPFANSVLL